MEDAAIRDEFEWGAIEWLANAALGNSRELSLARMVLRPATTIQAHTHPNCEEALYVVHGMVECRVGRKCIKLKSGARCVVPRGALHVIRNTGTTPAELIVSYSSAALDYSPAGAPRARNSGIGRVRFAV